MQHIFCNIDLNLGLGRAWTRPEARPEGVLGDPNPTRAFFGGPEADPSKIFRTRNPFFFSKSLFSPNLYDILRKIWTRSGPEQIF